VIKVLEAEQGQSGVTEDDTLSSLGLDNSSIPLLDNAINRELTCCEGKVTPNALRGLGSKKVKDLVDKVAAVCVSSGDD